jgi:hypothetical protein
MIFPFSIKYKRNITGYQISDEDLLNHIEAFLGNNRLVKNIKVFEDKLEFSTYKFAIGWGINNDVLAPIEKGKFIILKDEDCKYLTYEFFMYRLISITFLMSAFIALVESDISVGFLVFGILGGLNWIVALIRQGMMMDQIIKDYQVIK